MKCIHSSSKCLLACRKKGKATLEGAFPESFHVQTQHSAKPAGANTDEDALCLISVIKMMAIKPKIQKRKISWVLVDCHSQEQ